MPVYLFLDLISMEKWGLSASLGALFSYLSSPTPILNAKENEVADINGLRFFHVTAASVFSDVPSLRRDFTEAKLNKALDLLVNKYGLLAYGTSKCGRSFYAVTPKGRAWNTIL